MIRRRVAGSNQLRNADVSKMKDLFDVTCRTEATIDRIESAALDDDNDS